MIVYFDLPGGRAAAEEMPAVPARDDTLVYDDTLYRVNVVHWERGGEGWTPTVALAPAR